MFFKPRWAKLLTDQPYLVPDTERIRELEKLRREFDIPHDAFAMDVMGSPVSTRRVQRYMFEGYRMRYPEASEKELLKMVLLSRIRTRMQLAEGNIEDGTPDLYERSLHS